MQIYLDYSATTPCRPEVIATMQKVFAEGWGNPASLHEWGKRAAFTAEQARWQIAQLLQAEPESIIFTSGGTESDNLALQGVARRFTEPQHLIISSVEHSAITETAALLEQQGWQVTRLPVNLNGRVNPEDLRQALQPNTVLVSIIYGQSEVGTLQPIEALGAITQGAGALFHTDAIQVIGRLPVNVQALPVDLLSLSSHKIYGPQGVGALYVKPGISLAPLFGGGGQEQGLRSGTPAVPLIAGFGTAAIHAQQELETEPDRLAKLRDYLIQQLQQLPLVKLTGDPAHRLPHHASFCLKHGTSTSLNGRTIVKEMNLAGIGISSGSACHSGKRQPSPALLAMGYSPQAAETGFRFSLGNATTAADIDWVIMTIGQVLMRLTS
jgi:cysteine desulfurase